MSDVESTLDRTMKGVRTMLDSRILSPAHWVALRTIVEYDLYGGALLNVRGPLFTPEMRDFSALVAATLIFARLLTGRSRETLVYYGTNRRVVTKFPDRVRAFIMRVVVRQTVNSLTIGTHLVRQMTTDGRVVHNATIALVDNFADEIDFFQRTIAPTLQNGTRVISLQPLLIETHYDATNRTANFVETYDGSHVEVTNDEV